MRFSRRNVFFIYNGFQHKLLDCYFNLAVFVAKNFARLRCHLERFRHGSLETKINTQLFNIAAQLLELANTKTPNLAISSIIET